MERQDPPVPAAAVREVPGAGRLDGVEPSQRQGIPGQPLPVEHHDPLERQRRRVRVAPQRLAHLEAVVAPDAVEEGVVDDRRREHPALAQVALEKGPGQEDQRLGGEGDGETQGGRPDGPGSPGTAEAPPHHRRQDQEQELGVRPHQAGEAQEGAGRGEGPEPTAPLERPDQHQEGPQEDRLEGDQSQPLGARQGEDRRSHHGEPRAGRQEPVPGEGERQEDRQHPGEDHRHRVHEQLRRPEGEPQGPGEPVLEGQVVAVARRPDRQPRVALLQDLLHHVDVVVVRIRIEVPGPGGDQEGNVVEGGEGQEEGHPLATAEARPARVGQREGPATRLGHVLPPGRFVCHFAVPAPYPEEGPARGGASERADHTRRPARTEPTPKLEAADLCGPP